MALKATIKNELGPPPVYNMVSSIILAGGDALILSFAYFPPIEAGPNFDPNADLIIEARAASHAAIPAAVLADWLPKLIRAIADQGNRERFGWNELVAIISAASSKR